MAYTYRYPSAYPSTHPYQTISFDGRPNTAARSLLSKLRRVSAASRSRASQPSVETVVFIKPAQPTYPDCYTRGYEPIYVPVGPSCCYLGRTRTISSDSDNLSLRNIQAVEALKYRVNSGSLLSLSTDHSYEQPTRKQPEEERGINVQSTQNTLKPKPVPSPQGCPVTEHPLSPSTDLETPIRAIAHVPPQIPASPKSSKVPLGGAGKVKADASRQTDTIKIEVSEAIGDSIELGFVNQPDTPACLTISPKQGILRRTVSLFGF